MASRAFSRETMLRSLDLGKIDYIDNFFFLYLLLEAIN